MRVAVEPLGQSRQVGRNIGRGGLSREAAERTLIAARAGAVLAGSAPIVGVGAELSRVAEQRFKLGGDRGVIGAGESGRSDRGRRRGGEKLNEERERDQERGQGRASLARAAPRASRPKRKCPRARGLPNRPPRPSLGSRSRARAQISPSLRLAERSARESSFQVSPQEDRSRGESRRSSASPKMGFSARIVNPARLCMNLQSPAEGSLARTEAAAKAIRPLGRGVHHKNSPNRK